MYEKQPGLVGAGIPEGYGNKLAAQAQLSRPIGPDEVPNIEALLNQHLGSIEYMRERLEHLRTRLGPFLTQVPETARSNSALTARSGMGNVISSATGKIQDCTDVIQDLLDRFDN